jgi:choline dehydrogenase-like flavoprotein
MIRTLERVGERRLAGEVCIIGGGAAGLTLAVELARAAVPTIVLESGYRHLDAASQALYDSDVVGFSHPGTHNGRFRMLGGSSTRWAGQVIPLSDIDFEPRAWVADSGWPLRRDELDPYYARACAQLGVPPFPRHPVDGWPKEPPLLPFDRTEVEPQFAALAWRRNLARIHAATLERSRHIDVVLGANVTELVTSPEDDARVCVAHARSLAGQELEVAAQQFVVCTGGIETPRLLLASNLGRRSPLIGRCFQDHPWFYVQLEALDERRIQALVQRPAARNLVFNTRLAMSPERQRREGLLNASAAVIADNGPAVDSAKLLGQALRRADLRPRARGAARQVLRDPLPLAAFALRKGLARLPRTSGGLREVLPRGKWLARPMKMYVICEHAPNRDSRVFLSEERDALGQRRAAVDWQLTELEFATLRRCGEIAASELERLGIARAEIVHDPAAMSTVVGDSLHHMGTARMAASPSAGVVDRDCRFFGLENLYVAGTAVFPTSGYANPMLTLLALTIRLGDTLGERLGRR